MYCVRCCVVGSVDVFPFWSSCVLSVLHCLWSGLFQWLFYSCFPYFWYVLAWLFSFQRGGVANCFPCTVEGDFGFSFDVFAVWFPCGGLGNIAIAVPWCDFYVDVEYATPWGGTRELSNVGVAVGDLIGFCRFLVVGSV